MLLILSICCSAWGEDCSRIVSLSPSITESIYALKLGANLIGVTRYCQYPFQATLLPKVGGFLDTNLEALIALRPSLVVGVSEERETLSRLTTLGIRTLTVEHRNVQGILDSLELIGKACGVDSSTLRNDLQARTNLLQQKTLTKKTHTSVLVLVGSSEEGLYISGIDGFFADVLKMAGAENIYQRNTIAAPSLSGEGLIALNPEVIIFLPAKAGEQTPVATFKQRFPTLRAVLGNRVYMLEQDYATIPGPRFPLLLEKLIELLK